MSELDVITPEKLFLITRTTNLETVRDLNAVVDATNQSLSALGNLLPHLESLNLSTSIVRISDFGSSFGNLRILYLSNCGLYSVDGVGSLTALEELYLEGNRINTLAGFLGYESQLKILDLRNNDIQEVDELFYISSIPLEKIALTGNPFYIHCDTATIMQFLPETCKLNTISAEVTTEKVNICEGMRPITGSSNRFESKPSVSFQKPNIEANEIELSNSYNDVSAFLQPTHFNTFSDHSNNNSSLIIKKRYENKHNEDSDSVNTTNYSLGATTTTLSSAITAQDNKIYDRSEFGCREEPLYYEFYYNTVADVNRETYSKFLQSALLKRKNIILKTDPELENKDEKEKKLDDLIKQIYDIKMYNYDRLFEEKRTFEMREAFGSSLSIILRAKRIKMDAEIFRTQNQ